MSVPGIVQSSLDGEEIVARVPLGGDDELFVSPTETLIYRADGLLSDESVEAYPHEADRVTISEGRRKARFTLEYALEGSREFTVPAGTVDDVVHPVIAGVLNGNDITESGERVLQTFRFSELTVIVTSRRLVKHIGEAVWDEDYEEFQFEDVTGLTFEPGSVATQVVLEVEGRQQRIKAPNERATELREHLQRAIFEHHDVDSLEALNEKVGIDDEEPDDSPTVDFGEGVAPLGADSSSDRSDSSSDRDEAEDAVAAEAATETADAGTRDSGGAAATDPAPGVDAGGRDAGGAAVDRDGTVADRAVDDGDSAAGRTPAESGADDGDPAPARGSVDASAGFESSGFEPATAAADADVLERLDALEAAVERQTAILGRQQQTIEQLIEELRRGR